ncbi:MAG: GNAT family N-acetyltransferase [Pseudomonadota bacterium]
MLPELSMAAISAKHQTHATRASQSASDVQITPLARVDLPALVHMHDRVFGPGRYARTAYRVRECAPPLSTACRKIAHDGAIVGASQMTWVRIGDAEGMLLGPLCVVPEHENRGFGQLLVEACRDAAAAADAAYVILVGDLEYYERCSFMRVPPRTIGLPGPVDPARLLIWLPEEAECPNGVLTALPGAPGATTRTV